MFFECFLCQAVDEDDLIVLDEVTVEVDDFLVDRRFDDDSLVGDEADDEVQEVDSF